MSVKFDHVLSDTHRVSAYIGYSKREGGPGPSGPSGIPGVWNPFLKLSDTAPVYRGSLDSTLSPRLHNRFYFGLNISTTATTRCRRADTGRTDLHPQRTGLRPQPADPHHGRFPAVGRQRLPTARKNPIYSFNDDLTWTAGQARAQSRYLHELGALCGLGAAAGPGNVTFSTNNTALPGQSNRNTGPDRLRRFCWRGRYRHHQHAAARGHALGGITPCISRMTGASARGFRSTWACAMNSTCRRSTTAISAPTSTGAANPGASGRPGAGSFAARAPGAPAGRSLTPGWYGGFGPRFGLAWRQRRRRSCASPAAPVTRRSSRGERLGSLQGFAQNSDFRSDQPASEHVFKFSDGCRPGPKPPFIDPTFGNNGQRWTGGRDRKRTACPRCGPAR